LEALSGNRSGQHGVRINDQWRICFPSEDGSAHDVEIVDYHHEAVMDKVPNVTTGEMLKEEFLEPMGITPYRLAQDTGMPATRISQILKGNRRITANTALRLSAYFGNAAEFWMGIQDEYDLRDEKERLKEDLKKTPRVLTKAN